MSQMPGTTEKKFDEVYKISNSGFWMNAQTQLPKKNMIRTRLNPSKSKLVIASCITTKYWLFLFTANSSWKPLPVENKGCLPQPVQRSTRASVAAQHNIVDWIRQLTPPPPRGCLNLFYELFRYFLLLIMLCLNNKLRLYLDSYLEPHDCNLHAFDKKYTNRKYVVSYVFTPHFHLKSSRNKTLNIELTSWHGLNP